MQTQNNIMHFKKSDLTIFLFISQHMFIFNILLKMNIDTARFIYISKFLIHIYLLFTTSENPTV